MGISRSSSIVIAYLMRVKGMPYEEAHQFVRSMVLYSFPHPLIPSSPHICLLEELYKAKSWFHESTCRLRAENNRITASRPHQSSRGDARVTTNHSTGSSSSTGSTHATNHNSPFYYVSNSRDSTNSRDNNTYLLNDICWSFDITSIFNIHYYSLNDHNNFSNITNDNTNSGGINATNTSYNQRGFSTTSSNFGTYRRRLITICTINWCAQELGRRVRERVRTGNREHSHPKRIKFSQRLPNRER